LRFKSCCGSHFADRAPPQGLSIIPAFLDAAVCCGWVQLLEQQRREFVSIVDHRQSSAGHTVLRRDETRISERVDAGPLKSEVETLVRNAVEDTIARQTGRAFSWFIGPQILRYQAGGHYNLHADSDHWSVTANAWVKGLDRDISLLLYLNDDFTGGELSFPVFNYRYQPRPGDLLFFPSDFRYRHQAHPVTSGLRYVIVSWAAFRDEPRVQAQRPENRIDLD
jgi:predicted 2-oxoglutarate/Fe(II)-dependent dioxygenase YbiX